MASGVFLHSLERFMLSPLVTWVKTFGPNDAGMQLDFSELLDGVFLNEIMTQINTTATLKDVNKVSSDPGQSIQNLNLLVQQIKTYYLDHLRQLVMTPLPSVSVLGRTPYCEQSLEEMKKLLLLLLGCAVQCEKKEEYIERIQTLDYDTKASIAEHIKEVTHCQDSVLELQWLETNRLDPEELEALARNMALHLRRLLDQRDAQLETIAELMQEREGVVSSPCSPLFPRVSSYFPSMQQQQAGTQQHLAVELADSKAKIRRLRQELEEKSEQVLDCRQEQENMEGELKRLQQENGQLLAEARAARAYRDELDALRERAIRTDKLESEVGRYRDKLHHMEFYRTKVEELKEDNQVLQETKAVLEDQVAGWRARSDKLHQLEKNSLLLKARVHDLEQEKEVDRKRVEELQEENLTLCLSQRRSMEESQHLGWELEQLSMTTDNSQGQQSLSEEVSERTRSHVLRLEKENRLLLRSVEELRAASIANGPQHNHSHYRVNNCTSSTDQPSEIQSCYTALENGTNALLNGLHSDEVVGGVESETHLKELPDLLDQEKGQLEEGESGERRKELTSDLEVLGSGDRGLRRTVGPRGRSPGSKGSSPRRDGMVVGLHARSWYASKQAERLEAKCRALDTENQRLQASLDNTGRKLQRLEAEVQELEAENQSLQAALEGLRISSRRLEQLEVEKQSLEQESSALERDKRRLEKENRRLRQQAEIQETTLDSSNVRMVSLEKEARSLGKEVEGLRETAERVKGLERDNRELAKHAAIDQRTLLTLREELVSEKLKTQQRDNELERLAHELEMRLLSRDHTPQSDPDSPDSSRFKMLESELESSLKRSLQIKEDKMAALEARLQESSALNQQLRQELRTVRMNYEALQQREEEERTASSSTPPGDTAGTVSGWQRESKEATKELLRVKDRLIEVERNNATLEAERQAVQAQLRQLENQCESQQAQILALQRQTASLQENNTALQTHNATLQVEKSTLNSQSASLLAQNAQLQCQRSSVESERESTVREREELRGVHEQLLRDHERLAALHERQAIEYEVLMGKHGCLKNVHRTLELDNRTLQDRYNSLLKQRSKLENLETALKEEQEKMSVEKEQHRTTAAECHRLREEKDWLNQTHRQLLTDNKELAADHKQLKSQLNGAQLEHTRLQEDFSRLREQYQQLDIASTKHTNQCELLSQLKGTLEEENRHLLSQIQTLMLQNRTLLEQTMESKDLYHVEQRQYIDKLNELRRQKEKLEEKIMDQYKFYDPSPQRRRGNWIALKVKKLIKSRSRERVTEHSLTPLTPTHSGSCEALGGTTHIACHENGSFVSSDGSGSSASTVAADALSPRQSSTVSDLAYPSARSEEDQWADSLEQLEGSYGEVEGSDGEEEEEEDQEQQKNRSTSSLASSILTILHLHHHQTTPSTHLHSTNTTTSPGISEPWVTDKDSNDSAVPSGLEDNDELQHHGSNGTPCRPHSESSGEFSMSLDNEPWSNGSSPVQQPPSRRSSSSSYPPPSDASTPRHAPQQQPSFTTTPTHKEKTSARAASALQSAPKLKEAGATQELWPVRGAKSIRRGSSGKASRHSSSDVEGALKQTQGSGGGGDVNSKPASTKAETTRSSACSPITVLYLQGKSSSVSGCLNCFSTPLGKEGRLRGSRAPGTLPRASSVISTAEGSARRASVLSDCVASAQVSDQIKLHQSRQPDGDKSDSDRVPPIKPPRDPTVASATDRPTATVQETLFGSPFTLNSVFSNTIFSDSVVTTATTRPDENQKKNRAVLGLNPSPGRNVPCPSLRPEATARTLANVEPEQNQNVGHCCEVENEGTGVEEKKDEAFITT